MPKNVLEVISKNIPFPEDFDMLKGSLTIFIKRGYIEITRQNRPDHEISSTRYSYHPNEICDTGTKESSGVCIFCGRTLF